MAKNEDDDRPRRGVRRHPVRRRIGSLLVMPLLSLVVLWSFAAATSLGLALDRLEFTRVIDDVHLPAFRLQTVLQAERAAAVEVLTSGGTERLQRLEESQRVTDAALRVFRERTVPRSEEIADGSIRQSVHDLDRQYARIGALRAAVEERRISPLEAVTAYSALFDSGNRLYAPTVTVNDVASYRVSAENTNINWARDYMLREDAIVTIARSRGGRLTTAEAAAFADASANRRLMTYLSLNKPAAGLQSSLLPIAGSQQFRRYEALERAVLGAPGRRLSAARIAEWRSTVPALAGTWWRAILDAGALQVGQNRSAGRSVVHRLSLVGGLGLLVVIASIVLSLRLARDLSRELGELQRAARELAFERLPSVVARLRRGEKVDVAEEAPPLRTGRTTEVATVAEAIGEVQRTAVETAVGEARLRSGISRVFINLAWRNQSLLQRQLRMLDEMERRTSDPDELENLFRLDHLTTRMRRHAEGLVILSGHETVRGWNEPVPVEQLLRAAVAEVEDYARVDVMALSQARVPGELAADVVHLLAELIENATAFSPPTTEVLVRAEEVGKGLAVEITDRGVGIEADDLVEINRRLTDPPEFDLADSDRLGLFVVARLAARHGIEVTLQRSAFGGVTAVVLLRATLLVSEDPRTAVGPAEEAHAQGPAPAGLAPAPTVANRMPAYGRHRAPAPETPPTPSAVRVPAVDDTPAAGPWDAPGGEAHDLETGGLPRRSRQANLAPRLRSVRQTRHPASAARAADAGGDLGDRPAEANRDLLSSLQAGWTAARDEDED